MNDIPKKIILMVEDEAVLSLVQKTSLQKYGYSVITAPTGEKAIEIVASNQEIDLILMDIDLGRGLDGTQVAEIILRDHHIPVIFLSSHTEPEIVEKTEKISSYGYVVKNSSITVLDASIKMAFKLFEATLNEQKKEESLRRSEQRFRKLFEEAPLGMALINSLTGDIHQCNEMFTTITGRTREEIQRINWMSITHPDDLQQNLDYMALLNSGETDGFQMEKRFIHHDGSTVWVAMTVAKEKEGNDTNPQHFCMIEDITKRKRADVFRALNKDIFQILTENEHFDAMMQKVVDIIKKQTGSEAVGIRLQNGEDFPYFYQNGFSQDFFKTENTLTQKNSNGDICRDANGKASLECFCGFLLTGKIDQNNPYFSKGGSFWTNEEAGVPFPETLHNPRNRCFKEGFQSVVLVPIRNREKIIGLIQLNDRRKGLFTHEIVELLENIVTNIGTALIRQMENDTNIKYAQRIQLTMEAANIAWWEMDVNTGNVIFAKQKTDMLGYNADDFKHYTDFTNLVLSEDVDRTMKAMQDHFLGYTEKYETEYRIRCKSGEYKWFYDVGSVNKKDSEGKPIKVSGIVIDITERKRAENEIQSLLEEKDLILKEVHHRIKNNMNTIYGLLILQAGTMKDPLSISALEDSGHRVRSMMLLYDKLYRSPDFTELSVAEYINPLVDEILANFPNSSHIATEKNIRDFILLSKQLQPLGIIINELLTNIMKYAFIGRDTGKIVISASMKDNLVLIEIADNGNGMPESVNFENSSGFGLFLVNGLTQQLNGNIRIERGEGTKIILEFKKELEI